MKQSFEYLRPLLSISVEAQGAPAYLSVVLALARATHMALAVLLGSLWLEHLALTVA